MQRIKQYFSGLGELKYAAAYSLVFQGIPKAFSLSTSIFLARILSPVSLGQYNLLNNTYLFLAGLIAFGFTQTLLRDSSNKSRSHIIRNIHLALASTLILILILGPLFFVLRTNFTVVLKLSNVVPLLIVVISLGTILSYLNSLFVSILTGLGRYKLMSLVSTITACLQTVSIIILSYYFGLNGAIIGFLISSFLSIPLFLKFNKTLKTSFTSFFKFRFCLGDLKKLADNNLPIFLGEIITIISFYSSNYFLLKLMDNSFEEIAKFNICLQWQLLITYIPTVLLTALVPILRRIDLNEGRGRSLNYATNIFLILLFIMIPVVIVFISFSSSILSLYGQQYIKASNSFIYIVLSAYLMSILAPLSQYVSSIGKFWAGFTLNLIWSLSLFAFSFYYYKQGAEGLALSRLLSYIFLTVIMIGFIYSKKIFSNTPTKI